LSEPPLQDPRALPSRTTLQRLIIGRPALLENFDEVVHIEHESEVHKLAEGALCLLVANDTERHIPAI
jgi:hypothetical protein